MNKETALNCLRKNSKWILMVAQLILIAVVGIVCKDVWYSITISLVGVIFNLLVSCNIGYGFLFGFIYAIINGINAYFSQIYATFGFMIIMQAPFALYSFYIWHKNRNQSETPLKNMSKPKFAIMCAFIAVVAVGSYFLLEALKSAEIIPDTIFFVFSVTACILLAFRYKIAFIITLFSGLGGTVLWFYHYASSDVGLSIGVFYLIVTLNSIIGIIKNYGRKNDRISEIVDIKNNSNN